MSTHLPCGASGRLFNGSYIFLYRTILVVDIWWWWTFGGGGCGGGEVVVVDVDVVDVVVVGYVGGGLMGLE